MGSNGVLLKILLNQRKRHEIGEEEHGADMWEVVQKHINRGDSFRRRDQLLLTVFANILQGCFPYKPRTPYTLINNSSKSLQAILVKAH